MLGRRPYDPKLTAKPPASNRQPAHFSTVANEIEPRVSVVRQRNDSRQLDEDLLIGPPRDDALERRQTTDGGRVRRRSEAVVVTKKALCDRVQILLPRGAAAPPLIDATPCSKSIEMTCGRLGSAISPSQMPVGDWAAALDAITICSARQPAANARFMVPYYETAAPAGAQIPRAGGTRKR
jgi:hypothetical protein